MGKRKIKLGDDGELLVPVVVKRIWPEIRAPPQSRRRLNWLLVAGIVMVAGILITSRPRTRAPVGSLWMTQVPLQVTPNHSLAEASVTTSGCQASLYHGNSKI